MHAFYETLTFHESIFDTFLEKICLGEEESNLEISDSANFNFALTEHFNAVAHIDQSNNDKNKKQ